MMKKILLILNLIIAITLASIVAFVSVKGLTMLFASSGIIGLLFFITIEVSKIITTSILHTYNKVLNLFIKSLLTICVIVTMLITSLGVYGFLSHGYKNSLNSYESQTQEILLLENRLDILKENRINLVSQYNGNQNSINELRTAITDNKQVWYDREGNKNVAISSENRKALESQLNNAIEYGNGVNHNIEKVDSSILYLSNNILEIKSNNDISNELGPLIFISDVLNTNMDTVMKYFIILLIFIGDPMAVLLIISFNRIINNNTEVEKPLKTNPEEGNKITNTKKSSDTSKIKSEPTKVIKKKTEIEEPLMVHTKDNGVKPNKVKKNRGFSVNIPNRKIKSNDIKKI